MATGGQAVLRAKVRVPRVKALPRERLNDLLTSVWSHGLGLVVAPAGSGKTTLLAQFASSSGVPVAWYRAEAADGSAGAVLAHLERGLVDALGVAPGWSDVDEAIGALDGWDGDRALIAVDDLHALWGTEGEATLERLAAHLPPGVVMVAASRRAPGFNLSRLRVSDDLVEMGPEELRFRSWEVESLFHDFYGEPLRPDEMADLARRTEGWAAGLQLFHLATRGKPVGERRRVLQELGTGSRLVREYLARNVLDDLPGHVRDFLLDTCVLGRLTPALCDALTGATGSETLLADLVHRQIFTTHLDDEGSFRYHEVLRSHLEAVLVDSVGEVEARARYQRAGQLLEAHGHIPEALQAYCRAEDWAAATGVLGGWGEQVSDWPGEWIEGIPPSLLEHDPWLLLASARRNLALGRWEAAAEAYQRAEAASGRGQPGEASRREGQALAAWFELAVPAPADWTAILRLAVVRDPVGVARREEARLSGAGGALTLALASLLAGHLGDAARELAAVAARPDASPPVAVGAGIAAAIARSLGGQPAGPELTALFEAAEQAGLPWLAALARLVADLDQGASGRGRTPLLAKDDAWGLPLAQLCTGLGQLRAGAGGVALLTDAAEGFAAMGAPVLEAWARAACALARVVSEPDPGTAAVAEVRRATAAGRSACVPGPLALAALASALADPAAGEQQWTAARAAAAELGFDVDGLLASSRGPGSTASRGSGRRVGDSVSPVSPAGGLPGLTLRCFGPLVAQLDGRPLDLGSIKPRVRSLLRLLALHAGRPVHRDRLVDWLWPGEGDFRMGTRNLQVAVSSLRQLLEPGVARGSAAIVVRSGDTYRLNVAPQALDLLQFDEEVATARAATARGDATGALAALGRALDLYRDELLADEGAVEWVVTERDRYRLAAADASQARAELLLASGQAAAAAAEADRGLRIDAHRETLWRLLVSAYESAGERAAARRAQQRYEAVLRELGLSPSS